MAYATQQDLIDRIGADALYVVADRDGDGALDVPVVSKALDDAAAEMDVYLGARYTLPLAVVPGIVANLNCDIAYYRLATQPGALTEEIRQRYDDAIALLKRIAGGDGSLGIEGAPASNVVKSSGNKRVFTRDDTEGIL